MADWREGLHLIPSHMHGGVERYIEHGISGGSFMTAVFSNNLVQACNRADLDNLAAIQKWAEFLYLYVPSACYGSPEKVLAWQNAGGMEQFERKES